MDLPAAPQARSSRSGALIERRLGNLPGTLAVLERDPAMASVADCYQHPSDSFPVLSSQSRVGPRAIDRASQARGERRAVVAAVCGILTFPVLLLIGGVAGPLPDQRQSSQPVVVHAAVSPNAQRSAIPCPAGGSPCPFSLPVSPSGS